MFLYYRANILSLLAQLAWQGGYASFLHMHSTKTRIGTMHCTRACTTLLSLVLMQRPLENTRDLPQINTEYILPRNSP